MEKHQVTNTKDIIKDALFKLIEEKDYADITMSEIAKKSGLVRMTVYRHFKEKNHIVNYAFNSYIKALEENSNSKKFTLLELLEFRLIAIKNFSYIDLIVKNNLIDEFFTGVEYNNILYFEGINSNIENYKSADVYLENFIKGGIDSVTKEWLSDGMREAAFELASKICNIINRLINVE